MHDMHATEQLPNGWFLLRKKTSNERGRWIVLAYNGNKVKPEWVTWVVYRDDPATTSHGNYFRFEAQATQDFNRRA